MNKSVVVLSTVSYTVLLILYLLLAAPSRLRGRRAVADDAAAVAEVTDAEAANRRRREKVVEMTQHSWRGYATAAWGHDELLPVSNSSSDVWGNTAVTAFDALDTLLLMDLEREFEEASEMVASATFSSSWKASIFETTIRHVGAGLSAHALTTNPKFLDRARQIVDGLLGGFSDKTGIAYHTVMFGTGQRENEQWCHRKSILAEVGTIQLEFRYLSAVVNDDKYGELANKFTEHLVRLVDSGWPTNASHYDGDAPQMPHAGFWPSFVDPETGKFSGATSFASLSDSFYEYLLKQWILFGKKDDHLLLLYENAVEALLQHSLHYTHITNMAYVGHIGIGFEPTLDHLTCFVPGMLILGVMHGAHSPRPGHNRTRSWGDDDVVAAAVDLAATCYRLYLESPTGVGPEVVRFEADGSYKISNPKYILRPETVESLFYLYRYTGDERYRDWGWNMLVAIDNACRTPFGFSAIRRVDATSADAIEFGDKMESFWFAETLKYFFLLFSDPEILPLDKFVFTTEGHPLPILE